MNEKEGASLHEQLMASFQPEEETPETPEGEDPPENEEVPEGEETPEGEEAPEGEEETPEGEVEDEEKPEDADEETEGEEGGEKPAPKKPTDPINDPLPKGTLESTRERFQHVVGQLKEQTQARETAEANLEEIVGQITASGMDAEKYGVMLHYAAGVNSGDPVQMKRSYDILMGELKNLATALGEPLPGTNPLEGHADLIKLVEEKKVTPELALEAAIRRNRDAATAKLNTARQSSQQGDQAFQQAQQKSVQDFSALGKQLSVKDGVEEYKRKAGLVVSMFQEAIMQMPPNKRVAAFKKAYDNVPAVPKNVKAVPVKAAVVKKGATPLRGNKRPSGNSTSKAPKNLLEAMRQGLAGGE